MKKIKFTNATFVLLSTDGDGSVNLEFGPALEAQRFGGITPSAETSAGWVRPVDDGGHALVATVDHEGKALCAMRVRIDTKVMPGSAIAKQVEERIRAAERETGRKPGARAKKAIKEEVREQMLAKAFVKTGFVDVLVCPEDGLMIVGASSGVVVDGVVSMFCRSFPGVVCRHAQSESSPVAAMTNWVQGGTAPDGFSIDDVCTLNGEEGQKVAYTGVNVDAEDIVQRIERGAYVSRVAMTHDGKVSYLLDASMKLSRVAIVSAGSSSDGADSSGDPEALLLADALLMYSALSAAFFALLAELGGAVQAALDTSSDLLSRAASVVGQHESVAATLLQRELNIGLIRASRLLAQLESDGLVSAPDASGRRKVLAAAAPLHRVSP